PGQAHPRRHRHPGIPRRRGCQCLRGTRQRPGPARRQAVLPQGDRPGRQADPDHPQQARHRHRRPAGRRAFGLRPADRHADGLGAPERHRRPAHVRLHQRDVGKPMAVVYVERVPEVTTGPDGEEVRITRTREQVISVATINGVFGKEFQTTGLESPKEAADLALLLRAGALAAPMDFVEQRVVGPSLGKENVERGMTAVLYSFGFALVFFLIYYRMFGVVTCVALLLNLLMVVAVMSFLGATLTLPGLAGIALTVGMSVDANVLINERIREEL